MFYPKNTQPLTRELFQNPTSEYRGANKMRGETNIHETL